MSSFSVASLGEDGGGDGGHPVGTSTAIPGASAAADAANTKPMRRRLATTTVACSSGLAWYGDSPHLLRSPQTARRLEVHRRQDLLRVAPPDGRTAPH